MWPSVVDWDSKSIGEFKSTVHCTSCIATVKSNTNCSTWASTLVLYNNHDSLVGAAFYSRTGLLCWSWVELSYDWDQRNPGDHTFWPHRQPVDCWNNTVWLVGSMINYAAHCLICIGLLCWSWLELRLGSNDFDLKSCMPLCWPVVWSGLDKETPAIPPLGPTHQWPTHRPPMEPVVFLHTPFSAYWRYFPSLRDGE